MDQKEGRVARSVRLAQVAGRLVVSDRTMLGVGAALYVYSPAAGIPVIAVCVLGMLAAMGAGMAVRNVFAVALYRYAVDGEPKGGFPEPDLQHPFTKNKGG